MTLPDVYDLYTHNEFEKLLTRCLGIKIPPVF